MRCGEVLERLKSLSDPRAVEGMARYGINPESALGVSVPNLRKLARELGRSHELARELWASGIHEARILACLVDDPQDVTEEQMEAWVRDIDSWDVCDGCCGNLFDRTPFAYKKAVEWSSREEEFIRRAGFVLMAALAVHDKRAEDSRFERLLPLIRAGATDDRNFVRKAVNWALRQIGKRNLSLNRVAIETAEEIQRLDSRSARWVASDALRELKSEAVQRRVQNLS
ncbi:MAG: DNA alkylation repair protein [Chloroflexota bacterium]